MQTGRIYTENQKSSLYGIARESGRKKEDREKLESGKPQGVGISGGRVYEPGEGMGKLVYEQPGNEVDGSCHSKEGSK
jgi:hypothetical protein